MPESLTEMMAAGDPMLTPATQEQGAPYALPPPANTSPHAGGPGGGAQDYHAMQQAMTMQDGPPPGPPAPAGKAPTAYRSQVPDDVKDAAVVCMVAFLVLMPNVQTQLAARASLMENATTRTLVNAVLIALLFYFLKEHVVGVL